MGAGFSSDLLDSAHLAMAFRLVLAMVIGALIGLERTSRGRPAGFRTHAIVCLSTALLMLVPVYPLRWMADGAASHATIDPTRMAQGIMTGIGFLGAGTIMKNGLSVRGLTTAASIWITAAIGILIGIGFYLPAMLCAALTLGALTVFRHLERRLPAPVSANVMLRLERRNAMSEEQLRALLQRLGLGISQLGYCSSVERSRFQYRLVVSARGEEHLSTLASTLASLDSISEFSISPTGD
jgi:putative Mg2+ transporter-C (MgtC) family protein